MWQPCIVVNYTDRLQNYHNSLYGYNWNSSLLQYFYCKCEGKTRHPLELFCYQIDLDFKVRAILTGHRNIMNFSKAEFSDGFFIFYERNLASFSVMLPQIMSSSFLSKTEKPLWRHWIDYLSCFSMKAQKKETNTDRRHWVNSVQRTRLFRKFSEILYIVLKICKILTFSLKQLWVECSKMRLMARHLGVLILCYCS